MSLPNGETSIKRRTTAPLIGFAVVLGICWYLGDPLAAIAYTCGIILLFLASHLPVSVKRYLPQPIEKLSLRFWLMILALSAMILSGHLFSLPLVWKRYFTLAGLLLAVAAWYLPFPKPRVGSLPPTDSLHAST